MVDPSEGAWPFVPVSGAALPGELSESLLFGHLRGSFTGAAQDRVGYLEWCLFSLKLCQTSTVD